MSFTTISKVFINVLSTFNTPKTSRKFYGLIISMKSVIVEVNVLTNLNMYI